MLDDGLTPVRPTKKLILAVLRDGATTLEDCEWNVVMSIPTDDLVDRRFESDHELRVRYLEPAFTALLGALRQPKAATRAFVLDGAPAGTYLVTDMPRKVAKLYDITRDTWIEGPTSIIAVVRQHHLGIDRLPEGGNDLEIVIKNTRAVILCRVFDADYPGLPPA